MGEECRVPMKIPEVDVVHAETFERFVECLRDVFGVTTNHTVRDVSSQAKFRSEEDLVALARLLKPGRRCQICIQW